MSYYLQNSTQFIDSRLSSLDDSPLLPDQCEEMSGDNYIVWAEPCCESTEDLCCEDDSALYELHKRVYLEIYELMQQAANKRIKRFSFVMAQCLAHLLCCLLQSEDNSESLDCRLMDEEIKNKQLAKIKDLTACSIFHVADESESETLQTSKQQEVEPPFLHRIESNPK